MNLHKVKVLLCQYYYSDIFSKYGWVVPLTNKKCITTADPFQKMLNQSGRKANKETVYRGGDLYKEIVFRKKNDKVGGWFFYVRVWVGRQGKGIIFFLFFDLFLCCC